MKLKAIFTALIISTSSQAGFFDDIFGNILQYFNISGAEPGDLTEAIQTEALQSLGGVLNDGGGSVLQGCYIYSPNNSSVLGSEVNLNICGVLDNLPNLCESAPSLSAFGYVKYNSYKWDIKNACKNLVGDKGVIGLADYLPNANTNFELFNMNTTNTSSAIGGKIRYAFAETDNKHYLKALKDGDHETLTIFNNILNTSESTDPNDLDISKINVAYSSIDDYTESVQERVDAFRTLEDQLNISRVKELAYKTMLGVNAQYPLTADFASQTQRESAKLSARSKLLDDYTELVDKYVKMNVKDRMMFEYKPGVLDPTKDTVNRYQEEDRARVVFVIEKQKAIQAKILREEMKKGDVYKKRARREITRVMYATEELNEAATLESIQALIQ